MAAHAIFYRVYRLLIRSLRRTFRGSWRVLVFAFLVSLALNVAASFLATNAKGPSLIQLVWDFLQRLNALNWLAIVTVSGLLLLLVIAASTGLRISTSSRVLDLAENLLYQDKSYSLVPRSQPLQVVISSATSDLIDEQQAVVDSLRNLVFVRPTPLFDTDDDALERKQVQKELQDADIVVVIIGRTRPEQPNLVYDMALSSKKPMLIFLKESDADGAEGGLENVTRLLSKFPLSWTSFSSIDDLATKVQIAVGDILINSFRAQVERQNRRV